MGLEGQTARHVVAANALLAVETLAHSSFHLAAHRGAGARVCETGAARRSSGEAAPDSHLGIRLDSQAAVDAGIDARAGCTGSARTAAVCSLGRSLESGLGHNPGCNPAHSRRIGAEHCPRIAVLPGPAAVAPGHKMSVAEVGRLN